MYMKSFKDFRRRSVEAVLVTVGASEKTVDADFEILHTKFEHLCTTMNSCVIASQDTADHQKNDLEQANNFSRLLSQVYSEQLDTEVTGKWPQSSCSLRNSSIARKYSECCTSAHTIIGASCAAVYRDEGLEPFRAAATTLGPAVDETCKSRAKMVTDFDSYRRRLKALEAKRSATESTAKEKALSELNNEICKYIAKVQSAEQAYGEFNEKTKGDIIVNRVAHDELLDNLLVATIVCQADLHQRIATQLQQLVQQCPQDQVNRLRSRIDDHISKGGPPMRGEQNLPNGMMKNFSRSNNGNTSSSVVGSVGTSDSGNGGVVSSKNNSSGSSSTQEAISYQSNPAPYKQPVYLPPAQSNNQQTTATPTPPPGPNPFGPAPHQPSTYVPSVPFSQEKSRQFAVESKEPFRNYTTVPSALVLAEATRVESPLPMVVALYDHEAEADDELNFSAGDHVEVLEATDGGWWKGRCKGREGLFPVNYVQALS